MPKRFTVTEKWEDVWFTGLTIEQKVLWLYICDRCDCAGFWEINLKLAAFQSGIPPNKIQGAFEGLIRGYHVSTDERYVWLRNFVKHQGNLPLNEYNKAHVGIINRFKEQKQRFNCSIDDFQSPLLAPSKELPSSTSISKGISKGKGKGKGKGKASDFSEKIGTEQSTELSNGEVTVREPSATSRNIVLHGVTVTRKESFSLFWELYPRKEGKRDAEKAWMKVKLTEKLFLQMEKSLARRKESGTWDDKQFIPLPASWLRGERWTDEVSDRTRTGPTASKTKLFPIAGKFCEKPDCGLPAVYKTIMGEYNHFYCAEHMPEKVKAKYVS